VNFFQPNEGFRTQEVGDWRQFATAGHRAGSENATVAVPARVPPCETALRSAGKTSMPPPSLKSDPLPRPSFSILLGR